MVAGRTPPGVERVPPGPGQQSVWDYPTPPQVAPERRRVRLYVGGVTIVNSERCLRVLETGHPPTIYVPGKALRHCELRRLNHVTRDEWKGQAIHYAIIAAGTIAHRALWAYPNPNPAFRQLIGFYGVYPGRVGRALLDEEEPRPQEGEDLGGWITDDVVGPFKGGPGTEAW